MILWLQQEEVPVPISETNKVFLIIFFVGMILVVGYHFYKFFEQIYGVNFKKPFFNHFHFFKRKLTNNQLQILENEFAFYRKLNSKHKRVFQHRLAQFIKAKSFYGREDLEISDHIKVPISATAIMLTLGFRSYLIYGLDKIFVYPKAFYSKMNDDYHKGEFNPQMRAVVFSWEDFQEGFDIDNDNLNLGIHEFSHAIHINSLRKNDISAIIFKAAFHELTEYLKNNEPLRKRLLASKYLREYAYTNHFEFVAVLIESFIETPNDFKTQFPEIYKKVKQMLNFNFAGY